MGLSGTELLLKQVCNVMGIKPEDIVNSIETFKATIKTVNERQQKIEEALGTIIENQQLILNMLRLQQEGVAPGHVDLMEQKLLESQVSSSLEPQT